ncbi:MAG: hypothetical protein WCP35_17025, partial [Verrucomicrobiota bacterium]
SARVMCGDTAAGTAILSEVNWRGFMAQERKVFRSLLVKFESSKLPMPELPSQVAEVDPNKIPAWRKAVEHFEKDRAGDILPALLAPKIPGANQPIPPLDADPNKSRAWREGLRLQDNKSQDKSR